MSVLGTLHELRGLVGQTENAGLSDRIAGEIRKVREARFHLAVLGQFKRGKSSFVNALLGQELLPVGVLPVTSLITSIEQGPEVQVQVADTGGSRSSVDLSLLADFVTERGNPANQKGISLVTVHHPSPLLMDGLVLIDTPGVGSLLAHNSATTRDFLPRIDAAAVVFSPDPPVTSAEYEFLSNVVANVDTVLLVFNKIDLLTQQEMSDSLRYLKEALRDLFPEGDAAVYPVSSRIALSGRMSQDPSMVEASGIQAFERALRELMAHRKSSILERQSEKRARALVAEAAFEAALEERALLMPVDQLQEKVEAFQAHVRVIHEEREHGAYLLRGEIESLEHWIDEDLSRLGQHVMARVNDALDRRIIGRGKMSYTGFASAVQDVVVNTLRGEFGQWRREHEGEIAMKYDELASKHVRIANALIEKTLDIAGGLFEIRCDDIGGLDGVTWDAGFRYITHDDVRFLEFDPLRIVSPFLPRGMVGTFVVRRARQRAEDKVMRNCGRLRYEYVYTIQEASRSFLSVWKSRLEQLSADILVLMKEAAARRARAEDACSTQAGSLRVLITRLHDLQRSTISP